MTERVLLRDHSQPCETCGFLQPLNIDGVMVGVEACVECGGAGGREVTIDYEAAWVILRKGQRSWAQTKEAFRAALEV